MKTDLEQDVLVSVIIPTYNRASMVCDCIERVLQSDCHTFEVIVVDDASPDDTRTMIGERFGQIPCVRLLRNTVNLHQAGARNRGASVARGRYFFFLDDDNLIEPDCIRLLLDGFSRDPSLRLVAPLSIQKQKNAIWTLGAFFNLWTSMPINLKENECIDSAVIEDRLYPTWYSPNAFMVTREAFERAGGFDSFYRVMFDESDFGLRVTERKYGAIYPLAKTLHLGFLEPGKVPALRCLGIESPLRAFVFARNRSVFVKRFFPCAGKVLILTVFVPLFAVYYCGIALRNKRLDIAWAFLKGSVYGWFTPWRFQPTLKNEGYLESVR